MCKTGKKCYAENNDVVHLCVYFAAHHLIQEYYKEGICINSTNSYGKTAIFISCEKGNYDITKQLINCGSNINTINVQKSPINIATQFGYINIVKLLIDHKCNINRTNIIDEVIICNETKKDVAEKCLRLLIDAGLDTNKSLQRISDIINCGSISNIITILRYYYKLRKLMVQSADIYTKKFSKQQAKQLLPLVIYKDCFIN